MMVESAVFGSTMAETTVFGSTIAESMVFGFKCENFGFGWRQPLVRPFSMAMAFEAFNFVLPITGRTGHGKSTMLYALSGMAMPTSGGISWHLPGSGESGWSTEQWSFNAANDLRRRRFGFLLQDASLIQCFTVAENMRHTLQLRGITDDIERRSRRAIGYVLINGERPEDLLHRFPVELSGGMRQRAALAAAIAHDPTVLFADEPTASLDDESGRDVLRAIRGWLDHEDGKGERAFVFVTHRVRNLKDEIGARRRLKLGKEADSGLITIGWESVESERPAYSAAGLGQSA